MSHKEFLEKIGMELKVARVRAKLRRSQVCKITGFHKDTLASMENGTTDTRISHYMRLAEALGISLRDIL